MRTAYKCRVYPTPEQAAVFNRTFGCVRLVWNKALAERHAAFFQRGERTSYRQTDAALTAWKKTEELAFLSFAVAGDGDRIANPRHLQRKARNLARYQRRLARCRKGSANRRKARTRVAAAHRKVRNARRDFLIDRWYPSSKTCSACGYLLPTLDLSTRVWTCPACRTRHDRDINAAKNILAAGRAVAGEPGDACGADVRQQGSALLRSAVKQEASGVTRRIPVP